MNIFHNFALRHALHFKSELHQNGWRWTKTTCVLNFQHGMWILAVQARTL